MPFTLVVEFIGLSLLARRAAGPENPVIVAMPGTQRAEGAHAHDHVDPHLTKMFLGDAIRRPPGSPLPDERSLDGRVLRITERDWDGTAPSVGVGSGSGLLDIPTRVGGGTVKGDVFGDGQATRDLLDARVELRARGQIIPEDEEGYDWTHEDGTAAGSTRQHRLATWQITTADSAVLAVEILDFGTAPGTGETIPLQQLAGGADACLLQVFHVIDQEMPPKVPPLKGQGEPVKHFEVLYALLDGIPDRQQPRFAESGTAGARGSLQGCPFTRANAL